MWLQGYWHGSLSREPIYLLSDHQHACTLWQDVVRNVLIECRTVVSDSLRRWVDCLHPICGDRKLNLELRECNFVISILFDG